MYRAMERATELFWYLPGFLLLLVSNGRIVVPVAAWIAPVFILRACRRSPIGLALLAGFPLYATAFTLSWRGMIPVPWLAPLIGAVSFLPFVADRLLYSRVPKAAASLIYPSALVVLELVNSLANPMGTWGSVAYTQYGLPAFMQLASLGGTASISFLVSWGASVLAGLWMGGWNSTPDRRLVVVLGAVLLAVSIWGSLRIHRIARIEGTLAVASVTTEKQPRQLWDEAGRLKKTNDWNAIRTLRSRQNGEAFRSMDELAAFEPAVVFTHETAFATDTAGEDSLLADASRHARTLGAWLVLSFEVSDPDGRYEDRVVVFSPHGDLAAGQFKYGGAVIEGFTTAGDGNPAIFEVDGARVATYICWDMDFPRIVRRLGRNNVDVVLVPGADWREIDPMNTRLAVFRAIENGVSLVRQAAEGLSLACDPAGTTIAMMDHFTARRLNLYSQVPARGVRTLYSVAGDWVAWLSLICLAVLIGLSLFERKGRSASIDDGTGETP